MASGWIDQHHGKILDFLGTLDVESAEEVTEDLLRGLFRNDLVKFDMDFIKKTDISPEVVLLWRVYCEWVADERVCRPYMSLLRHASHVVVGSCITSCIAQKSGFYFRKYSP
jgi:hypothetical protein